MIRTWSVEQNAIFEWFAKHPTQADEPFFNHLIVRARAGTGKTTTIVEGVNRAPEATILVCAYNKKIAEELVKRVSNPKVTVKTLHAVGYAAVRRFRERITCDFSSTRADALTDRVCPNAPDAIKRLVSKLHTKGREVAPHANYRGDLTALQIQFECEPDEQWAEYSAEQIEQWALDAMDLAAQVRSGDTIDGSDMIFLPVRNGWLTKQFDLVVVDEAQDMTTAQLEIAQGVNRGRMCVVGDDRQAIYAFRGADSGSLDRLKSELNAAELGLKTTYRCGQAIVTLAQTIVPDFEAGPENPEGEVLDLGFDVCLACRKNGDTRQCAFCSGAGRATNGETLIGTASASDFILSRLNAPLVSIAMQLLRAGKRTRIAGRDIGKGLITLIRKMKARSVPDLLTKIGTWESREVGRLQKLHAASKNDRRATIEAKIEAVRDQAEMLVSLMDGAKNVTEVETRIDALFADDGLGDATVITCSSVHRSKGLEANRVFVLTDTLRSNNQEELNIQYVAYTRAKQTLVMVRQAKQA